MIIAALVIIECFYQRDEDEGAMCLAGLLPGAAVCRKAARVLVTCGMAYSRNGGGINSLWRNIDLFLLGKRGSRMKAIAAVFMFLHGHGHIARSIRYR